MLNARHHADCFCSNSGPFRGSLAPLTCLFNLLITAIVERFGPTLAERVARNRELQSELNPFDV